MLPPFTGQWPISAGWRYSSGAGHFAYDYDCDTGTPLYAVGEGRILACADGVANNPPGYNPGPGAPSNWILLGTRWQGEPVSCLYQHLSPGLKVHTGQQVKEGHNLGRSGNTGNSTGDHLHFAAMFGWWEGYQRYIYMSNDGNNPYVIYPPDRLWKDDDVNLDAEDRQWMKDMIDRVVWEHPVRVDYANHKTITFNQAVSRWNINRSPGDIAEASARATVRALKEAGLVGKTVDVDKIVSRVVEGVTAEQDVEPTPADTP